MILQAGDRRITFMKGWTISYLPETLFSPPQIGFNSDEVAKHVLWNHLTDRLGNIAIFDAVLGRCQPELGVFSVDVRPILRRTGDMALVIGLTIAGYLPPIVEYGHLVDQYQLASVVLVHELQHAYDFIFNLDKYMDEMWREEQAEEAGKTYLSRLISGDLKPLFFEVT